MDSTSGCQIVWLVTILALVVVAVVRPNADVLNELIDQALVLVL